MNERVNERMNGRDGVTVVVMHLPGKGELNPLANAECCSKAGYMVIY